MKNLIDYINKSERFLRTAKLVFEDGDYDSCVSRCYYGMFIIAEAVLLTKKISSSSHKGVISLIGQHFVKTGIFEKDIGKALNDIYDKRLLGDYNVGMNTTKEDAEEILTITEQFILTLKKYLDDIRKD
ncbi:MAG: HEPN domain-containing protein [Candidatus Heimdallarchaeota archaeon]|nr:HEPN domain-containing protein [Candidatus Heimdallarchaeota archaeon]